MYEPFFSLAEPAFSPTPDSRFLWLSRTHRAGLQVLERGIERVGGVGLLTGEVGSGKTTLLRALRQRFSPGRRTAWITHTRELDVPELHTLIAAGFALPERPESAAELVELLHAQRARPGQWRPPLLFIDEGQHLDDPLIEELQRLSQGAHEGRPLLQIVFAAQPELRQRLEGRALEPLARAVHADHHLALLAREEVRPFLAHRVQVAGGRYERIFAPDAEAAFAEKSEGCPRVLGALADRALRLAFVAGERPVSAERVGHAAAGWIWDSPSAPRRRRSRLPWPLGTNGSSRPKRVLNPSHGCSSVDPGGAGETVLSTRKLRIRRSPDAPDDSSQADASVDVAGTESNAEEALDQVRELLFGPQALAQRQALDGVEQRVGQQLQELRDEVRSQLSGIEAILKREISGLGERLAQEERDRQGVGAMLNELRETMDRRVTEVTDAGRRGQADLRDQLLSHATLLTDTIQQRHDEALRRLDAGLGQIEKSKADRSTLSTLLQNLAQGLESAPTQEEPES